MRDELANLLEVMLSGTTVRFEKKSDDPDDTDLVATTADGRIGLTLTREEKDLVLEEIGRHSVKIRDERQN